MKNSTAASLIATIAALKRALSRTPTTSSTMIASTMITAGRLMTAPGAAAGAAVIHVGSATPNPARMPLQVAAPADRDGHRADRVLEDQVPADHPREELAERGVGVGVGAARRSESSPRTPRSRAPRSRTRGPRPRRRARWPGRPGWPPRFR